VNGIVVGSPTLDGSITYQHLVIVGVPLPSGVTADQVWTNSAIQPYLANATLYQNWTSAAGTFNGTSIYSQLTAANVSYGIYSDNANDTTSLLLTQLPGLTTVGLNGLKSYSNQGFPANLASGTAGTVIFYNSSLLNYSTLAYYLQQATPLVQNYNLTLLYYFVPEPSSSTPVQLPNFIWGANVTGGNDTVSHDQSDVANAIEAIYLHQTPTTQSYSSLKKLFARNRLHA